MPEVYEPAEDSYLLSEVIGKQVKKHFKKNHNLKFLEIGAGSGIQLKTAHEAGIRKENIYSCDLNPKAISHCKRLGFNCFKSDLFNVFKKRKDIFDIIVFNPPYLPFDKKEPRPSRLSTTGGLTGGETINRFLKEAKHYLKKEGKIILLTSDLSSDIDFSEYRKKLLAKKKLFFEELYIWGLSPIKS